MSDEIFNTPGADVQEVQLPYEIVFVSGAPRSGTTLAHALICTSDHINAHIGESSYFSELVRVYHRGVETFDIHTRYFYASREGFMHFHRELLNKVLDAHWRHLGCPEIMVLKDPDMLSLIPTIAGLLYQAKFVILCRDPLDVIASRVQVQRRRHPHLAFTDDSNLIALAEEYVSGYGALEALNLAQPHRVFYQAYEEMVLGNVSDLQRFIGVDDLRQTMVWQRSKVEGGTFVGNPWNSTLYFKPISSDSIGSFKAILGSDNIKLIESLCQPIAKRLEQLVAQSRAL